MVDPYAIVRRLTGHELISPKDARLLTEAVDGLIGEIGSKDARIAELEAEVERLRRLVMAQSKAIHSPEAPSRTGAVKVLPRPDAVSMTCGTICLEYADYDLRDEAYDWLEKHASSSDDALGPAAPEDREAVTWTGLLEILAESSFVSESRAATLRAIAEHLRFARPAEQAVTDAMVEAVVQAVRPYTMRTLFIDEHRELVRAALKAAMEAGR